VTQLEAFVTVLTDAAAAGRRDFVVVSCDAVRSFRFERFERVAPRQLIDVGIAEASAVVVAYGLWRTGLKVFVVGFASFVVMRALEAIRSYLAYHEADVTVVGGMAGLSAARDGFMHHATEDVGVLRAIPGMRVMVPSDAQSARAAAASCLASRGPRYVRLVRRQVDLGDSEAAADAAWTPLRWRGAPAGDMLVCVTGPLLAQVCSAAAQLRRHGVRVAVLEVCDLAPFPAEQVRAACAGFLTVVVCEEHQPEGALGTAVQEALAPDGLSVVRFDLGGVEAGSGDYDDLLRAAGISAERLVPRLLALAPATAQCI
jgi:transketolase